MVVVVRKHLYHEAESYLHAAGLVRGQRTPIVVVEGSFTNLLLGVSHPPRLVPSIET